MALFIVAITCSEHGLTAMFFHCDDPHVHQLEETFRVQCVAHLPQAGVLTENIKTKIRTCKGKGKGVISYLLPCINCGVEGGLLASLRIK